MPATALLSGHAGVHHRHGTAADRRHGRRAVGLEDVGDDADGVGELLGAREHRDQGPPGEGAVADLAPAGAAQETRLADREGREVVVQHEGVRASRPRRPRRSASRPTVPRVQVTRAWVSPRVKSAEPWVRGRTPTSQVTGRISSKARPSRRLRSSRMVLAGDVLDHRAEDVLDPATSFRRPRPRRARRGPSRGPP